MGWLRALAALAFLGVVGAGGPATAGVARIVHGAATASRPAVAAVLVESESLTTTCSGVLIGCSTVLTAARCVCPAGQEPCQDVTAPDPSTVTVYFPAAGVFTVAAVAVHPGYAPPNADVAILQLDAPVSKVAPIALAGFVPGAGAVLTAVGFGSGGSGDPAIGLLRETTLTSGACPVGVTADAAVCWTYTGAEGSACTGDAGGPLLLDDGTLAGIIAGGTRSSCAPTDARWGMATAAVADWLAAQTAGDDGSTCGDGPMIGEAGTNVSAFAGTADRDHVDVVQVVNVPEGTAALRVGLHGVDTGRLDVDLLVRAGAAPTSEDFDCADVEPDSWAWCEITDPDPGPWYVDVHRAAGSGAWQLSVVTIAASDGGGDDGGWDDGGSGGTCGDGYADADEECDGDDAFACTAGCAADCTCIPCGGMLSITQIRPGPHMVVRGEIDNGDASLAGFDPRRADLHVTLDDQAGGHVELVVPAGDAGWRTSKPARGVFRWRGHGAGMRRVVLRDRTRKTGAWSFVVDARDAAAAGLDVDNASMILRSDPMCAAGAP